RPNAIPVSCFIIAFDEADRIERTIRAVAPLVSEVVVVDSGSTDGTPDLCRSLGARVISNPWPGYGPQKRFAEAACRHDWVLNLDADEVLTDPLKDEIRTLFRQGEPDWPFFRFKVVTVYPGHEKPRLWADWYNVLRLYDRRHGGFRDSLVHDSVVPGEIKPRDLAGIAHHYCYRSLEHLAAKQDRYTKLQSLELRKPKAYLATRLIAEFPLSFFKYYVLRRQFTGGAFGLGVASILAYYRTVRIWRLLKASG
ncbi:MAG: glycosyltransferase family 2 protein, partial [Pseudomonadota bacterium]